MIELFKEICTVIGVFVISLIVGLTLVYIIGCIKEKIQCYRLNMLETHSEKMRLGYVLENIIIPNTRISLWTSKHDGHIRFDERMWSGMNWEIPDNYKSLYVVGIFGSVAENIDDSDIVNIRVTARKPCKKKGGK